MKVLIVSLYFPPAGGGGVQRPLKFATHLPSLGIETHVLAPDDPKWIHRDDALPMPTQAWVHRARYFGPKGRKPAEELHGKQGLERASTQARLFGRRLLLPDENVSWNLTAVPAAIKIVKQEGIDVVLTTSPPSSVHLIGAAVKRTTGVKWVADLRDSLVAHPHRRPERLAAREHAIVAFAHGDREDGRRRVEPHDLGRIDARSSDLEAARGSLRVVELPRLQRRDFHQLASLRTRRLVGPPGVETIRRRGPRDLLQRRKLRLREEPRLRRLVGRDLQRAAGDVRAVDHDEDREPRPHPRHEEPVERDVEA